MVDKAYIAATAEHIRSLCQPKESPLRNFVTDYVTFEDLAGDAERLLKSLELDDWPAIWASAMTILRESNFHQSGGDYRFRQILNAAGHILEELEKHGKRPGKSTAEEKLSARSER